MVITNKETGHRFFFDDKRFDGIIVFEGNSDHIGARQSFYVPEENGFRKIKSEEVKDIHRMLDIRETGDTLFLPGINDSNSLDLVDMARVRYPGNVECRMLLWSIEEGEEKMKERPMNVKSYTCLIDFRIDVNTELGRNTLLDLDAAFPKAKIKQSLFLNQAVDITGRKRVSPIPDLRIQDVLFHVDSCKSSSLYNEMVQKGFGYLAFVDGITREKFLDNIERDINNHGLMLDSELVGDRTMEELDPADLEVAMKVVFGKPRAVFLKLMLMGFSAYDIILFCEVFVEKADPESFDVVFTVIESNEDKMNRLENQYLREYQRMQEFMPNSLMTKIQEMVFLKDFSNRDPKFGETRMEECLDILHGLRKLYSKREIGRILQRAKNITELRKIWEDVSSDIEGNQRKRISNIVDTSLPQNRFKESCRIRERINGESLELITSIEEFDEYELSLMMATGEFTDSDLIYRRKTTNGNKSLMCVSPEGESVQLVFMVASKDARETMAEVENKYLQKFKLEWLSSRINL